MVFRSTRGNSFMDSNTISHFEFPKTKVEKPKAEDEEEENVL